MCTDISIKWLPRQARVLCCAKPCAGRWLLSKNTPFQTSELQLCTENGLGANPPQPISPPKKRCFNAREAQSWIQTQGLVQPCRVCSSNRSHAGYFRGGRATATDTGQGKGKLRIPCLLLAIPAKLTPGLQGGPSLPLASARPTRADHGCTFTLPAFQTCSTEDARKYSRLCSIIYANPRHTGGGQQELQQTQSNFSPTEESCMKSLSSKLDLLSKHKGQVLLGTWKGRSTMLSLQTVKS